jgi:GT2 family glycosyltransferase
MKNGKKGSPVRFRASKPPRRFPAGCTIVSRSELSSARVVAFSYLRHHPGARFYLLVVDRLPEGEEAGQGICVIDPEELKLPDFTELSFKYTPQHLCTALQPAFLSLLLNGYREAEVIYLESGALILARADRLLAELSDSSLVLPRLAAEPDWPAGLQPAELETLSAAAGSPGFIAVRQSDTVQQFLRWWQAWLRNTSRPDVPEELSTDHRWIELVPLLFPASLCNDEAYTAAYWKTHSYRIERARDTFSANGKPLVLFDFRGFDPTRPTALRADDPRSISISGTAWLDLLRYYVELLQHHGFETCRCWPYGFSAFDNGAPVSLPIRKLYAKLDATERATFGNPFQITQQNSFFNWATSQQGREVLSPFLKTIYELRPDVASEFLDVQGRDREGFLHWAYTQGAREFEYDPDAMQIHGETGALKSDPFGGSFDNGVPLNAVMRMLYSSLKEDRRLAFGDPRRTTGGDSFFEWATQGGPGGLLSPFLKTVYNVRPDVMAAFPDIEGKDRAAFLRWACGNGAEELGYDPKAMRVPHEPAAVGENAAEASNVRDARGPKCSIIIPVYNNSALTRNCLDSLPMASGRSDYEVIVVDDASTDETQEMLRGYGDGIRIVTHRVNSGFAVSCNDGVTVATGEYLIFLNNDTISKPGWLDELVKYAESHREAAIVGAKLLFPNDTIQHAGLVICEDREPRHIYEGFPADHPAVNQSRAYRVVTGACFLIRRREFDDAKGFDTGFRNGYEDVDLCLRLGELGREVHYCHESVLYHLEAVSRDVEAEETANRTLYRSRWAERVRPDEFDYYVRDGLLNIEYRPHYPVGMSISPLLAVRNEAAVASQTDEMLQYRSRQVLSLLKENIRLNLRVQQAELSRPFPERIAARTRSNHSCPLSEPRVLCRGHIQKLSSRSSNQIVSIIIPVKNGAPKLRELLPAVMAQRSRDAFEIVAVDSGSTDESVDLLRQFDATVVSIDPRVFNHGLTRNLATHYAAGSVFVFLNQSTVPGNDQWLHHLTAPLHRDSALTAVCGRVLPRSDADVLTARDIARNINASTERIVAEIADWAHYQSLPTEELRRFVNFHTLSAAIRADVFRKIPFRQTSFAEDLIWGKEALEAGHRIQFEPASVAYHSHNYSALDIFRRNFDDGIAGREIVGRTLAENEVVPSILHQIRDDWRYLQKECDLEPDTLEDWRMTAAMRRTAQWIGQWLGINFDGAEDLVGRLSLVEQIKAGAQTDTPETGKAKSASSAG